MKKTTLTVIVVLISAWAQGQGAKFGIKGGVNLSLFGNDIKSKVGFQAGIFSTIQLADKWYVQPEALYVEQSVKREDFSVGLITFDEASVKIASIYIPVVVKYYPVKQLYIESGPQVGFVLASKAKADYEGANYEFDAKDQLKEVDFGLNIGSGYDFNKQFSLGIRYYVGITKMANSDYVKDFYNRNSILSLSAAYSF